MRFIFRFNPESLGGKKFINVIQVTDPLFDSLLIQGWMIDDVCAIASHVMGVEICCSTEYSSEYSNLTQTNERWAVNSKDGDFLVEADSLEELKGMYVEYFL